MTRREAIRSAAAAALAAYAAARTPAQAATSATTSSLTAGSAASAPTAGAAIGPFVVPPLPYAYDALEPHIDALTMHLHHDKYHAKYVENLNIFVGEHPELVNRSIEDLLRNLLAPRLADSGGLLMSIKPAPAALRNNGGGHYNHSLFWQMLKKNGGVPTGDLATAINAKFGSYEGFQEQFTKAALDVFGSGWAWLSADPHNGLMIETTPNQDSRLMYGRTPILGIDVWEHAYYLQYQNKRANYIQAFYHVINWGYVAGRYQTTRKA